MLLERCGALYRATRDSVPSTDSSRSRRRQYGVRPLWRTTSAHGEMPELWRSSSRRLFIEPMEIARWRWSRLRGGLGRLRCAAQSWPPAWRLRGDGPRARARPQRQPDHADATGRWLACATWSARDRRRRARAGHPTACLYPCDERQAEA